MRYLDVRHEPKQVNICLKRRKRLAVQMPGSQYDVHPQLPMQEPETAGNRKKDQNRTERCNERERN